MRFFRLTLVGEGGSLHQNQPLICHYGVITSFFSSTLNTKVLHYIVKMKCKHRPMRKSWLSLISLIFFIVAVHDSAPQSRGIPSFYLI